MRRKLYRRNADEGIRRSRRGGDPVANLIARIRAGQLAPENVSLASYLGDPIAQQVLPPPPDMTPEPVFSDGSFAVEILNKAAIGQREAVLFAADCATRSINEFAVESDSLHIAGLPELAYRAIEAARAWVNGSTLTPPDVAGEELRESAEYRRVTRIYLSAYSQAIELAYYVSIGCRRQPHEHLKAVPLKMAGCYRQRFFDEENLEYGGPGHGANQNNVNEETRRAAWGTYNEELAWADGHLARCLLSEVWPTIEPEV